MYYLHNANKGINYKPREEEGYSLSINSKPTMLVLGKFFFLAMTLIYQESMEGRLQVVNLEDIGLNMIALYLKMT